MRLSRRKPSLSSVDEEQFFSFLFHFVRLNICDRSPLLMINRFDRLNLFYRRLVNGRSSSAASCERIRRLSSFVFVLSTLCECRQLKVEYASKEKESEREKSGQCHLSCKQTSLLFQFENVLSDRSERSNRKGFFAMLKVNEAVD